MSGMTSDALFSTNILTASAPIPVALPATIVTLPCNLNNYTNSKQTSTIERIKYTESGRDLSLDIICSMYFKEDTSLLDHLNEFQGTIDQMLGMGIKFEDEILRLLLLNSLPESWETFKKLTKGNLVMARGEKISKLYWTKALVAKDSVNVMDMEASLWTKGLVISVKKG
ncbi:hypothetical protein CR513_51473, partial [Mucuna pruriens]